MNVDKMISNKGELHKEFCDSLPIAVVFIIGTGERKWPEVAVHWFG